MATIHYISNARSETARPAPLPGWMLDRIAEQKLTGGYDTKPSNICDRCHLARSRNGSCGC